SSTIFSNAYEMDCGSDNRGCPDTACPFAANESETRGGRRTKPCCYSPIRRRLFPDRGSTGLDRGSEGWTPTGRVLCLLPQRRLGCGNYNLSKHRDQRAWEENAGRIDGF